MVHAKNYETMSTFVKIMHKKLWPLFFRTRCIYELLFPHYAVCAVSQYLSVNTE